MEKLLLCLVLFVGALRAVTIQTQPCEGIKSMAKVTSVGIEPCTDYTSKECSIPEGTNSTIEVHFTPATDLTDLTTDIHAKIGPIWVPYPMDKSLVDACKSDFIKCPMKAGVDNYYHFSLLVSTTYPKLNLRVRWQLFDEKKQTQVCVEFPIRVV